MEKQIHLRVMLVQLHRIAVFLFPESTANAGNANNVRNVTSAGGLNNNNANNSYAVRAD